MLNSNPLMPIQFGLTKLLIATVLASFTLVVQSPEAEARAEQMIFEVSVEHSLGHRDVVKQAEVSAQQKISQQFRQNPEISSLQMSVVVNRNGEIIPVFVTTVSREQWLRSGNISSWTKYHNSYALLRRHDVLEKRPTVIASVPRKPTRSGSLSQSEFMESYPSLYESSFDQGSISKEVIQDSLDYWD